jgi:hypothetical protein
MLQCLSHDNGVNEKCNNKTNAMRNTVHPLILLWMEYITSVLARLVGASVTLTNKTM